MKDSQLLTNYFVLTNVVRGGNDIAICRHKTSHKYEFFFINNEQFQQVDKTMYESLSRVYNNDYAGYDAYSFSSSLAPFSDELSRIVEFSQKCIKNFTKDLDRDIVADIEHKLDTIKIFGSEVFDSYACIPNISALYQCSEHFIAGPKEQLLQPHLMLHEMLHASSKGDEENCGFRVFIPILNQDYGKGINESATNYYVKEILPNQIHLKTLVTAYGKLIEGCDTKEIKKCYFKSDFNSFVDYLTEYYKLYSKDEIYLVIDLFDGLYNCIIFEENKDYDSWTTSLYKQIIRLQMNKQYIEKNEVDTYTFYNDELKKSRYVQGVIIDEFITNEKQRYYSLTNDPSCKLDF